MSPNSTKAACFTVSSSVTSDAATRYTRKSGPLDVEKLVRRRMRRPSASDRMVAFPVVSCALLRNVPCASGTGAAAVAGVAAASDSLTVSSMKSRSGRNAYQARTPSTITRPSARRLIDIVVSRDWVTERTGGSRRVYPGGPRVSSIDPAGGIPRQTVQYGFDAVQHRLLLLGITATA